MAPALPSTHRAPVCFDRLPIRFLAATSTIPAASQLGGLREGRVDVVARPGPAVGQHQPAATFRPTRRRVGRLAEEPLAASEMCSTAWSISSTLPLPGSCSAAAFLIQGGTRPSRSAVAPPLGSRRAKMPTFGSRHPPAVLTLMASCWNSTSPAATAKPAPAAVVAGGFSTRLARPSGRADGLVADGPAAIRRKYLAGGGEGDPAPRSGDQPGLLPGQEAVQAELAIDRGPALAAARAVEVGPRQLRSARVGHHRPRRSPFVPPRHATGQVRPRLLSRASNWDCSRASTWDWRVSSA